MGKTPTMWGPTRTSVLARPLTMRAYHFAVVPSARLISTIRGLTF